MDFLLRLEQTGFASWIRESTSLFAFPGILLLHTIGMALVVGISAGIDLRILGLAPALPVSSMEDFYPILWLGFWINAATGTILLIADASTKLANPDFYVKMVFIALALISQRTIRKRVLRDPKIQQRRFSSNEKVMALASLIFWFGAVTAGRLLAYVGPVSGLE